MERELSQEPSGADESRPPAPGSARGHWNVAGQPVSRLPLLGLSAAFGAVIAVAAAARSGGLDAGIPRWDGAAGYWPVSAVILALVSATWLAGAILVVRLLAGLRHWNRATALFAPPIAGALAAFGLGPLLVLLFFALVGLAGNLVANPAPAFVAAALALAPFAWARSAFALMGGELLLSLFAWLALVVLPAFWDDPVSRLFARVLLDLLDIVGVLP